MRALAPEKKLAPQDIRTFFISATTWGRRNIFQTDRMAELFLDVLRDNRAKGRFQVHEFVLMRNHFHALITPAVEVSLEKSVQYIKGGFSFRAKRELEFSGEVWQEGYNEHRVTGEQDYRGHLRYIHDNPVKSGFCERAEEYEYSSANRRFTTDPAPERFRG